MNKLTKLVTLIWILCSIYLLPQYTQAQFSFSDDFPYTWIDVNPWTMDTDFSNIIKNWINEDNNNWFYRLLRAFMPKTDMYMQDGDNEPSFIFYLKTIVNLLLSFVSFIALIFVIYAFYMIFFKKDEAGITTAKQIIKWVIIALFVIWLSRIVVSFLYRFEKENTQNLWYEQNSHEISTSLT